MAKRDKKTRTGPRFQWLRNINWGNVRRGSIAAVWVVVACVLGAAVLFGVPRLEAYAVEQSRNVPVEIRFIDPPAWLQGELEERLIQAVRFEIGDDPLRRPADDLRAARDALLNSGWFDEIRQVRRVHAGLVEIDARFVDPYALIRDRRGDNLIDSRGRLLPRTFPPGHAEQFTVITGVRFPGPARPGMEWEGADIAAALRLLRVIEPQPWREQVRMIDVTGQTQAAGTGSIKLITDRSSWILWGSPPGEEAAMEALTERKLQFLNHNHREFGHIDGNHQGEVDITDHQRVINR